MSGLELNKIAAAILLAGLIAMVAGNLADALYRPDLHPKTRGYQIAVTDQTQASTPQTGQADQKLDIVALLTKADAEHGKKLTKVCSMCHTFDKGESAKIGPNLWGVIGEPKLRPGFDYSEAMKNKGGTWTYDDIFHFINNPQKFVPGTKMTFPGYKKPEDVADVIAYLRQLSDSPEALPK